MLKYIGDFERLKEFGFVYYKEESPNNEYYNFDYPYYTEEGYEFDDGINTCKIMVKRINSNWKGHPNKERELYFVESDCEVGVSSDMYDIVYDLIKAGLVEKVVEE